MLPKLLWIWTDWKSLNGWTFLEDIYIKFRETELAEFHNCLACEFTGHYACKNAEMNLKSTSTNGFNFRIINSLMASWGYAWPGLTVTPLGDLIFMHHKNSLFRVHLTLTNIQLTPKRSNIIYNLNQTINLYSTIQLRERLSDFREK